MKLLLVEDDARLAGAVRTWMGHGGIEVEWITLGREIEPALRQGGFDWVVLDLGLPDIDGETALQGLRAAGYELPVLVMTAREQVKDRVRLLDLGADDFLVKPVHLDELAARLRAVQRRQGTRASEPVLRHGGLTMMMASRTVSVDGSYVALTNHEFTLLEALLRRRGSAVSRDQLLQALGAAPDEAVGNAVDVHVHHLRRKLGAGLIRTVRGVGYTLGPAG
ncbi:Transcriptional regulatory protein QseB [Rubrivivax sp. A210]|uniref:response regulator n=1 Tax=Rubrivivax sp. A210 TaxID=2772301 RepID=UPI00191A6DEA|nr:response regulator [Rubrivivax sp. A210]CAD5366358.1 Transcriptional regulatory protein QseB [Rubrivivax sp. A210]